MDNYQLRALKKYVKISQVIKSLPVEIPNWAEKLTGTNGKAKGIYQKDRAFSDQELALIESALLAIAHTIYSNKIINNG